MTDKEKLPWGLKQVAPGSMKVNRMIDKKINLKFILNCFKAIVQR
jgi:hypothetical protein